MAGRWSSGRGGHGLPSAIRGKCKDALRGGQALQPTATATSIRDGVLTDAAGLPLAVAVSAAQRGWGR